MNPEQKKSALAALLNALVDAVAIGGADGMPGGTLYASLMTQGCTLQNFETLMSVLVDAGRLRKEGHLYFVVPEMKVV
jgi:hypothetical protein